MITFRLGLLDSCSLWQWHPPAQLCYACTASGLTPLLDGKSCWCSWRRWREGRNPKMDLASDFDLECSPSKNILRTHKSLCGTPICDLYMFCPLSFTVCRWHSRRAASKTEKVARIRIHLLFSVEANKERIPRSAAQRRNGSMLVLCCFIFVRTGSQVCWQAMINISRGTFLHHNQKACTGSQSSF